MPKTLLGSRPWCRTIIGLSIAGVSFISRGDIHAQDADPPTAEQILDRYVEVTGGEAAYEALTTQRMSATLEVVGTDLKGRFESLRKAPGRFLRKESMGSTGETVRATDGATAWEISPIFGARLLEGVEQAQFVREAVFNGSAKWRDLYLSVERTGEQEIDGEVCHVVVQTPEAGGPETIWYGKESGLMRQAAMTAETSIGPLEVELTLDDYKEFDGVKLPTTIRMTIMDTEIRTIVQEVEHNVEIPDATFAPPESVQALLGDGPDADRPTP